MTEFNLQRKNVEGSRGGNPEIPIHKSLEEEAGKEGREGFAAVPSEGQVNEAAQPDLNARTSNPEVSHATKGSEDRDNQPSVEFTPEEVSDILTGNKKVPKGKEADLLESVLNMSQE